MAQNFVGSNNINLFMPNGQMGTRLMGGQDSASERYIYTQLSKITRHIFSEKDDKILKYLDDDGTQVEPIYYAPIIPMVLVNGSKGIGTGFSTNILLTVIASTCVAIVGMIIALTRTSRSPALLPFRILATAYVDVFRGIPMLLVILLVGFGIPALRINGLTNNVLILGTVAVIITYSAYVAEVLRSGILTVHPSQRAAARSLGLSHFQTLRFVVLPQALRRVTPPLLNDLVSLIKDTGLVSILGVTDAIRAAQIASSRSFNYTPYVMAAIIFLLITIPLTRFTDRTIRRSIEKQNAQGLA
jgi:polar amino acid transport system permease protein